jgi:AsmA protein
MKKVLLAVGLVLLLLVALVVLLPFIVDLNSYQAKYRPIIEEAINRKIELKDTRLTIIPRFGVRVAGFTVMDDPAFSTGPFASLTSLDVGVKLWPLLSKRIEVEEVTLRDPVITVIKNAQGVLNTATIGKKGAPKAEAPAPAKGPTPPPAAEGPLHILTLLAVDRVAITGGQLTYRDQSAAKPTEYVLQKLEFLLKSVRLGETARVHAATTVQPYNLPVKVDGTFGPLTESLDLKTIDLMIGLGDIALAVKGSDVGGDLKLAVTSPTINTADLPVALPLKKPIEAKDLKVAVAVKGPQARLQNLSLNLFGGQLAAQGGLTTGSAAPPFDGKVAIQGIQLGPLMEAVGTDKVSISGTAAVNLTVRGAGFSMPDLTNALEGPGRLQIKDGKIEGINLLKEAFALLKAVGVKQDTANATVFSTIESDLKIKRGIITVERLLMDSHDFQATANGTVGFDQTLNLKANLNLSEALSKSIVGSSPVARFAAKGGRMTVPLLITGTAQAPSYALDTKAMGTRVQEQVKEQAKEKLGEILKGKGAPPGGLEKGEDSLKKLFGQ